MSILSFFSFKPKHIPQFKLKSPIYSLGEYHPQQFENFRTSVPILIPIIKTSNENIKYVWSLEHRWGIAFDPSNTKQNITLKIWTKIKKRRGFNNKS
jgi:hypothetical protein